VGKRLQRPRRAYTAQELDELERLIIALVAFDSAVFTEVLEHQPMTALFPTFGNLLQRAKRLLASDVSNLWQGFMDACEADAERYQQELEAKGHADFYPGLYW
jgi:hypothetical protein